MTDDVRSLLTRLLAEWDGDGPAADLKPLMEEVRAGLLADADRRKAGAAGFMFIPSERLDESSEFRAATRKAQRLHMAYDLFRSLVAGCWREAVGPGNSTDRIRQFAWQQADHFLTESDRPTPPPPAASALAPVPPLEHQRAYLEWLRDRGGDCLVSEHPPGLNPLLAADVRRHLLKRGLLAATHRGRPGDATGYAMTAAGWNSVEPAAVCVKDGPTPEAA